MTTPPATVLAPAVPVVATLDGPISQGTWHYYYVDLVPYDVDLQVTLDILAPQDLDLYVRHVAPPTLEDWDCRPNYAGGLTETCSFPSPATGRWWIGVNNYDTGFILYAVSATWANELIFADGFESGDTSAWSTP